EPVPENGRSCPCTGSYVCSDFSELDKVCIPREGICALGLNLTGDAGSPATHVIEGGACDFGSFDGGIITPIDDVEDIDPNFSGGGVTSFWFESKDSSEGCGQFKIDPIPGGRCGSQYAVRLVMAGLSDWGAQVGFSLKPNPASSTELEPLDISQYAGIQFLARSGSTSTPPQLQVKLVDASGAPSAGQCRPDAGPQDPGACYIPFLKEVDLANDSEWHAYRVSFAELTRNEVKTSPPDLAHAYQILWGIAPALDPNEWGQFDLWIDDVAWYR
ncbi:MAG TPA: hypothetical protein VGL13_16875, partial [Polyangiaceae bacterium]